MFEKKNTILLLIGSLVFFLMLCVLGYYNRLVAEDYSAVIDIHQYGAIGGAVKTYNSWGGNLFPFIFSFIVVKANMMGVSFFWYHLLSYASLYSAVFLIFKKLNLAKNELNSLSLLFFTGLFYITFGVDESWFWIFPSTSYLWGLIFCLFGVSFLLSPTTKFLSYLFIIFCFLYTGSASEPFAMICILFLGTFILVYHRKIISREKKLQLLFALLACILGFIISEMAPGTINRKSGMPPVDLLLAIKRDVFAIIKFYIFYLPYKIPYIILFGIPFYFFGNELKKKNRFLLLNYSLKKIIVTSFVLFNTLLFLSYLPVCYIMGEAGPLRSWHHISLYLTVVSFFVFFYAGYISPKESLLRTNYLSIVYSVILLLNLAMLINQYQVVSFYAISIDERNEYLTELNKKNTSGTVRIKKLPPSGFLFSQEISSDKNDFTNQYMKQGLNLKYDVVVDE